MSQIKNKFCGCEDEIVKSISKDGQVDLTKFCDLIDLFVYIPKGRVKVAPGKLSPNIFRVLSSNQQEHATAVSNMNSPSETHLQKNMELIQLRIEERFPTFSHAFRFFDLNFNNRVSFNEFSKGLEYLKVKINMKDQMRCFKHLDTLGRGYITYDDFCALTVERRTKIDPASKMIEEYRQSMKEGPKLPPANKQALAPEVRERMRQKRPEREDLSELELYLRKISLDDLINLKKDRKSSKCLEGGPMISGRLAQSGLVKKGYSVPHAILDQEDRVYGNPSFHGQGYTELKEIIENTHFKETLLDKVKRDLVSELEINKKVKQDWRNNAFNMRQKHALDKANDFNKNHWTQNAHSPLSKLCVDELLQ